MLNISQMNWFILRYCSVILFILLDFFLPINAAPTLLKSVEREKSQKSKHEQYFNPEAENENVSEEDCSKENSEIYLTEKPSKTDEKKIASKTDGASRKYGPLITYLKDGMIDTDNQTTKSHTKRVLVIYPGTKWCGIDNIAEHDDDLGSEVEADICCRAHDRCQDFMHSGETKYNLTNKSPFVSLSCQCDYELHECLRQANTPTSNSIGYLYFNVLARKCFSLDYPKKCKKYVASLNICSEFEQETSGEKVYQWFPAKKYKKL